MLFSPELYTVPLQHRYSNKTQIMMSLSIFCGVELILAEALVKDKEAGTFVVRDSTSYKGSFGLAMKVDQTSAILTANNHPGKPFTRQRNSQSY